MGSYCLVGTEFLFRMMKKLEIDSGNGCPTRGMHLVSPNFTFKNGYSGKYAYILCSFFKKEDYLARVIFSSWMHSSLLLERKRGVSPTSN